MANSGARAGRLSQAGRAHTGQEGDRASRTGEAAVHAGPVTAQGRARAADPHGGE